MQLKVSQKETEYKNQEEKCNLKVQEAENKLNEYELMLNENKEKHINEINLIKEQNESISNKLISLNKECNDNKKR